jgi:hypothetical protein
MNIKHDRKTNLETTLVITTGLVIFYLIKEWNSLLIIAAVVGGVGVFFNKLASYINWMWYKLAELLGKVVPKIILTAIFYLFLFPISMLYRLFNKDSMLLKPGKRKTVWVERQQVYEKKDISNPW